MGQLVLIYCCGRLLQEPTISRRNIYWSCVGETQNQFLIQKQSSRQRSERTLSPPTNISIISWVQAANGVDRVRPVNGDEFTVVLRGVSNQAFALRIHGDSMKPEFSVGEVIIVDPAVKPRIGKYVVAKIETGNGENRKAIVKQLVRHRDQICLKPSISKNGSSGTRHPSTRYHRIQNDITGF